MPSLKSSEVEFVGDALQKPSPTVVDVLKLPPPIAILRINAALREAPSGTEFHVLAPATAHMEQVLAALVPHVGGDLMDRQETAGVVTHMIRRR